MLTKADRHLLGLLLAVVDNLNFPSNHQPAGTCNFKSGEVPAGIRKRHKPFTETGQINVFAEEALLLTSLKGQGTWGDPA